MPAFTIPLKRVIELTGGTTEFVDGNTKVIGGNIGLSFYPLFDETYRDTLNGKIVDHYWNREIGVESVDMFQLAMRRKMNEIMPYYNDMYKSQQLVFDPLKTVDLKTINSTVTASTREADTEASTDSTASTIRDNDSTSVTNAVTDSTNTTVTDNNTDSGSRTVSSEFPQTQLNNSSDYATSAADATSKVTATGNGTETGNVTQDSTVTNNGHETGSDIGEVVQTGREVAQEDATQSGDSHVTGYQGVPTDLLMRYRESILNIDLMVIAELAELFMIIWDTSDDYAQNGLF